MSGVDTGLCKGGGGLYLCIASSIYMYVCAYDQMTGFDLELNHMYVSCAQSYLGGSDQGLIKPNTTGFTNKQKDGRKEEKWRKQTLI